MQLRDELLLYAKHIGHFALNPNSVAILMLGHKQSYNCEMHFSYNAKHIGHFALNPNSVAIFVLDLKQASGQLRDELLLYMYAKHIGHFALNPNSLSYPCSDSSNHAIARWTSFIRQTHWPLFLKSKFSSYTRARSQAIMQLWDELLLYAKPIDHFALNLNSLSYPCSVSSNHAIVRWTSLIRQTRWQRCLKSKFGGYSCSVSSNHTIARCTSFIRQTHWPLCLKSKFSSCSWSVSSNHTIAKCTSCIRQAHRPLCLKSKFTEPPVLGLKQSWNCEMNFSYTWNTLATLFKIQIRWLLVLGLKQSYNCEMHFFHTPNTLATLP
jgi:hypothetical protein